MVWWTSFTFGAAFFVLTLQIQLMNAGNTTCASSQLDWYTSVVGESPCVTYQRLRQICNNDYQVQSFRPTPPGDQCDDQVSACCCNTIAFQLSMLCMNCQYDPQPGEQTGIDAGIGAYTLYRGNCGAAMNNSLPNDIQSAVCNLDIRLDNFVYGGWADGSCVWTKENAERDHAANNNNTFTHCTNQISPSSTPTPLSSSTVANATTTISSQLSSSSSVPVQTATDNVGSGSNGSQNHVGAIVGGVIGGVGAIVIIGGAIIIWRLRRYPDGVTRATRDQHYNYMQDNFPVGVVTPFTAGAVSADEQMSSPHGAAVKGSHPRSGARSPSWAQKGYLDRPRIVPSKDSFRHDDSGPVVGLIRSSSGRLPPAYRVVNASSNAGSASVADTMGSGYSEMQPFEALALTVPDSGASPSFLEPDPHMSIIPLKRTSMKNTPS